MNIEKCCDNCKYEYPPYEKQAFEEPCKSCGNYNNFEPYKQSNYDRIRNMSVEELAKLLCNCSDCGNGRCYGDKLCTQDDGACNGLIKWLESEVTE